jgi:uncharacterized protein YpmS
MSENGSVAPNGIWKWIAAILIAIMLAGAPSIIQAIKAPTQEEVDIIRERQNLVLQRLAAIDIYILQNRDLLIEIQEELRAHEQETLR